MAKGSRATAWLRHFSLANKAEMPGVAIPLSRNGDSEITDDHARIAPTIDTMTMMLTTEPALRLEDYVLQQAQRPHKLCPPVDKVASRKPLFTTTLLYIQ